MFSPIESITKRTQREPPTLEEIVKGIEGDLRKREKKTLLTAAAVTGGGGEEKQVIQSNSRHPLRRSEHNSKPWPFSFSVLFLSLIL